MHKSWMTAAAATPSPLRVTRLYGPLRLAYPQWTWIRTVSFMAAWFIHWMHRTTSYPRCPFLSQGYIDCICRTTIELLYCLGMEETFSYVLHKLIFIKFLHTLSIKTKYFVYQSRSLIPFSALIGFH